MTSAATRVAALALAAGFFPAQSHAATPYGYGGNTGWLDFAPSAAARVSAGDTFLKGGAYAGNFGWIDLAGVTMPGVTAALGFTTGNPMVAGDSTTLRVDVFGSEALSFQWLFKGVALPGATGRTGANSLALRARSS